MRTLLVEAPWGKAHVHTERGRAAFLAGRHEEAVAQADRATRTEGAPVLEQARAMYLRGRALRVLDRVEGARESLRDALAIFESNDARQQAVLCWRELGEIAEAEGDYLAATAAFRSGVAVVGEGRASLIF